MASQTEICNAALSLVAGDRIITINENTRDALACKAQYAIARDAAVEDHLWGFARWRAALPQSGTAPNFGAGKYYQLPSDCLRVWALYDSPNVLDGTPQIQTPWEREMNYVYVEDGPATLYMVYIRRVEDELRFSALFTEFLVHKLAWKTAIAISESASLRDRLQRDMDIMRDRAISADSQQGSTRRTTVGGLTKYRARRSPYATQYDPGV